jgi:L-lactate dehydrogenase
MQQMDFLVDQCHANAPINADQPVRLPGEQATRNIETHRRDGVPVSATTVAALREWARKLGVNANVLD